jgi:peroxiredoxin Q/BCP
MGISSDTASHQKFAKQFKLPLFFCQIQIKNQKTFWGMFGLLPGRVTYVTDKNGVVQMIL